MIRLFAVVAVVIGLAAHTVAAPPVAFVDEPFTVVQTVDGPFLLDLGVGSSGPSAVITDFAISPAFLAPEEYWTSVFVPAGATAAYTMTLIAEEPGLLVLTFGDVVATVNVRRRGTAIAPRFIALPLTSRARAATEPHRQWLPLIQTGR